MKAFELDQYIRETFPFACARFCLCNLFSLIFLFHINVIFNLKIMQISFLKLFVIKYIKKFTKIKFFIRKSIDLKGENRLIAAPQLNFSKENLHLHHSEYPTKQKCLRRTRVNCNEKQKSIDLMKIPLLLFFCFKLFGWSGSNIFYQFAFLSIILLHLKDWGEITLSL